MRAADVVQKLEAAGMNRRDVLAITGLYDNQLDKVLGGENLETLRERHVLSNYMGFKDRAEKWNKGKA